MKAIKLASIFAVSAVAAAVSTTTIAAEPVFSGDAGLSYTDTDGSDGSYGSEGEVNIKIDTGVVYMDLDWESGDDGGFDLDEAYVTQGAVQFGDFDGSLIDSAAVYGGVDNGDDYVSDLSANLGVRYAVTDELTVAFEATQDTDNDGLAVAYTTDLDVATLYLSGGIHGDDGSAVAVGAEIPLGNAFTLAGYAQSGTTTADADMGSYAIGFDFAVSDALTLSAAYMEDTETDDVSNVEFTAFYTAGDVTYMVDYVDYSDEDTVANTREDFVKVSAVASF
ncbi:hypothetical protein [Marinomonas sp. PE14-40]|uniref:hypothetical protein n=1 Tax=Marinomonas sp. PE14-40 TaxID=3060621 RepID=UPI003F673FEB